MVRRELERYFPVQLRERFPDAVAAHKLRREIIATQLANAIVNRAGPTAITRLTDETGADQRDRDQHSKTVTHVTRISAVRQRSQRFGVYDAVLQDRARDRATFDRRCGLTTELVLRP